MSTTTFEDDYEDFDDEIEDDLDDDNTLSGLTVLLMGLVVLGAIFTVAWMSYQYGVRSNNGGADRYVAADPEPVKIENSALSETADNVDREVYDRFNGGTSDPVEVIAQGPEEPIDRSAGLDPITEIVEANGTAAPVNDDAVADRIAALAAADETLRQETPGAPRVKPDATTDAPRETATRPTPASASGSGTAPAATASLTGGALAGSHLVQIGAFRSEDEANGVWTRLQLGLGDFAAGKATDIERADLGDRGVYYRLRIGPFASKEAAVDYCEGLKDRGQDCLVKAK